MFFTPIAYVAAWILFVVGLLSVGMAFFMNKPPGFTEEAFFALGVNMFSSGCIMIAMGIGIGVLTEISNNIAKR